MAGATGNNMTPFFFFFFFFVFQFFNAKRTGGGTSAPLPILSRTVADQLVGTGRGQTTSEEAHFVGATTLQLPSWICRRTIGLAMLLPASENLIPPQKVSMSVAAIASRSLSLSKEFARSKASFQTSTAAAAWAA
eukprot:TRINITY_DN59926_c0_g1_i1.p2 TRINITY_DN59926_c0_g1~~TRINITY_DN59926_c0_g1_i1.p2  ORF type:complete len:135 (-),score=24.77 TRINITY_DN59926_c0_g1_i1:88-492(-)